jgi:flagellar biosynthetic protein FliQ
MADDVIVELLRNMLFVGLALSLPVLLVVLALGLVIGLLQAVTSIQEQTLSFVPKVLAIVVVYVVLGHWMLRLLVSYTADLLNNLPRFGAL